MPVECIEIERYKWSNFFIHAPLTVKCESCDLLEFHFIHPYGTYQILFLLFYTGSVLTSILSTMRLLNSVTLLIILSFTIFQHVKTVYLAEETKNEKEQVQVQTQVTEITKQATPSEPNTKSSINSYSTSVASLLGAIQNSSFNYFNIGADDCRNRASCDLGYMLYKRIGFIHNWVLRTSVRHMVDPTNIYAQAWVEGMLGRNCSAIHINCQQSPLDSLMGLALLQRFAM